LARRRKQTLTEVELEFMQAVWEGGEVTTEDVRRALARRGRQLSDGSVRKVLSILMDKGYVTRRPEGRGHVYRAVVPKTRATRRLVADLLRRAFGGSASLMVATLLDAGEVDERELEEIRRVIREREEGQ
jgi:predicted transcriptional regulator